MAPGRKRRGTVENSDVVETEKTALENVHAVGVFAIHPPGEIKQEFVENFFEEATVRNAAHAPFDFVNAPGSPCMDRRINVTKSPLVSRQLPVGMHVPFAKQQNDLFFRIIR